MPPSRPVNCFITYGGARPGRSVHGPGAFAYLHQLANHHLQRGEDVLVLTSKTRRFREFAGAVDKLAGSTNPAIRTESVTRQVHQPVFGAYDFAGLVGLWLSGYAEPAAHLLSPFISTDSFSFDAAEYVQLQQDLQNLRRQFTKLPSVSTALDDLNTGFFRHQEREQSEQYIRRTVETQTQVCTRLQHAYATAIHEQARYTEGVVARRLTTLSRRLQAISEQLRESAAVTVKQRVPSSTVRESLTQLLQQPEFSKVDQAERQPTLPLPPNPAPALLAQIIERLATQLNQLRRDAKLSAQRELLDLTAATATAPGVSERLNVARTELADLLRDLNEAGLYQLPFAADTPPTAQRQQQLVAGIAVQLRNTAAHLHEWPAYHERSRIWYAQPARLRRLTAPLLEHPSATWQAAFRGWYLARCLEKFTPQLPIKSPTLTTQRGQLRQGNERAETADFACVIDLLEDSTSAHWRPASYRDLAASHFSLAPPVDQPTLFFHQPYHVATPPDWRLIDPPANAKAGIVKTKQSSAITVTLGNEISEDVKATVQQNWAQIEAAQPLTVAAALTDTQLTEALLSDGLNGAFLAAVLVRAAAATTPEDRSALGQELYTRLGLPAPPADPFAAFLATQFSDQLEVQTDVPWRFTRLPLVTTNPVTKEQTAYLYDYELGEAAGAGEVVEQALHDVGYRVVKVNPLWFWWAPEQAIEAFRVKC